MKEINLRTWLGAHSTKVEHIGSEIVFSHMNGETSVLVLREGWRDGLIAVEIEPLNSFYSSILARA